MHNCTFVHCNHLNYARDGSEISKSSHFYEGLADLAVSCMLIMAFIMTPMLILLDMRKYVSSSHIWGESIQNKHVTVKFNDLPQRKYIVYMIIYKLY